MTVLFSSNSLREIEVLSKKIPYSSKDQTSKILHQLENIYINSVVADDQNAIKKSLVNIIKCQKSLGIKSKSYEKELRSLTKTDKIAIAKRLNIVSIKKQNDTIIIKFNKLITKPKILFFEINRDKQYRDVYDIKANLNFKSPNISFNYIDNIVISQNKENKVRLVLKDKNKIYSNAYIRQGSLFIQIHKNPNLYTKKPKKTIKRKTFKKAKKITKSKYASSKIVVIDPGHGGKDGGAVGYKKYKEKNTVLKISKILEKLLKNKGYKVYMTRDKDKFIDLHKRTEFANKKDADLFISIHANASPSSQKLTLKGLETFFLSPAKSGRAKRVAAKENNFAVKKMDNMSKNTLLTLLNKNKIVQSNKLAIDIQRGMLTEVRKKYKNTRDGGVREAPFWVLVGAQMPAVLVETGYITNPTEADRLFNPFYQKALAIGIANGINDYFINN